MLGVLGIIILAGIVLAKKKDGVQISGVTFQNI